MRKTLIIALFLFLLTLVMPASAVNCTSNCTINVSYAYTDTTPLTSLFIVPLIGMVFFLVLSLKPLKDDAPDEARIAPWFWRGLAMLCLIQAYVNSDALVNTLGYTALAPLFGAVWVMSLLWAITALQFIIMLYNLLTKMFQGHKRSWQR